jgi:hypothetical protein
LLKRALTVFLKASWSTPAFFRVIDRVAHHEGEIGERIVLLDGGDHGEVGRGVGSSDTLSRSRGGARLAVFGFRDLAQLGFAHVM